MNLIEKYKGKGVIKSPKSHWGHGEPIFDTNVQQSM